MRIKVPYFKQDTNYSCGPTSVQMILRYFRIVNSENDLIKKLKTENQKGTSQKKIIEIFQKNHLFCYTNNNSSIEEIKNFLKRKLPVLVNYVDKEKKEGHFAVIIGIKEEKIILNDPWYGEDFEIDISEFKNRWRDSKGDHKNWILVASPKDLEVGKQFLAK